MVNQKAGDEIKKEGSCTIKNLKIKVGEVNLQHNILH